MVRSGAVSPSAARMKTRLGEGNKRQTARNSQSGTNVGNWGEPSGESRFRSIPHGKFPGAGLGQDLSVRHTGALLPFAHYLQLPHISPLNWHCTGIALALHWHCTPLYAIVRHCTPLPHCSIPHCLIAQTFGMGQSPYPLLSFLFFFIIFLLFFFKVSIWVKTRDSPSAQFLEKSMIFRPIIWGITFKLFVVLRSGNPSPSLGGAKWSDPDGGKPRRRHATRR